MRPEALELDGFTAFREPTRVDFNDTDLFAFAGPTGAGKSSLIDAMVFALYGSVPRLGEKAVAPVISQGRQDARFEEQQRLYRVRNNLERDLSGRGPEIRRGGASHPCRTRTAGPPGRRGALPGLRSVRWHATSRRDAVGSRGA